MFFPRLTLKTRLTILFPLAITLAVGILLFLIDSLLQDYIHQAISGYQFQIIFVLLISTFGVTRHYLHGFTTPVVQLTEHVKTLAQKTGKERIFPVQGEDEFAILAAAFNTLIKEVDRQQDELASREILYRTVVDASAEMVFWITPDHQRMHYVSPSCQSLTGYPCTDFYTHPELLHRMIHPLDLPRWEHHCQRANTQDIGMPQEFRIVTADGETRWVNHLCRPVYNKHNEFVGVRGSFLDITLWKEAEAALFASEEKFRLFFEEASDAIFIVDQEGIILVANDEACLRYGFSHGEVVGRPLTEFDATEKKDFVAEQISEIMIKGATTFESKHRRKGALPLAVEVNARLILFEGKKVILAVARDISERKELEGQLRHAQKMDAIGQLAGGVAHDFNNILTAVIGYASIMHIRLPADSPLKKSAEQIMETAERGARLTQGLLAFSRKQVSNPRVIDLNEIPKQIEQLLNRLISEDLSLRLESTSCSLPIVADSVEIEQILMNLTTNARDALPAGGEIVITTTALTLDPASAQSHGFLPPGDYALLNFTDNGQGMDQEIIKRIFEPFYTTKEVGKGTGLGLSIVYGIIKKHHGYIICHSIVGSGTTFEIYFPLVNAAPERIIPLPAVEEDKSSGRAIILLAEDSETARTMMQDVLEEFGYVVLSARDGQEAIDLYHRHRESIDLLLLDVMMPKLKGREVYDAVRCIDPTIKALFCSGYDDEKVERQGGVANDMNFLSKPFTPKDLLMKIREVLHAGK